MAQDLSALARSLYSDVAQIKRSLIKGSGHMSDSEVMGAKMHMGHIIESEALMKRKSSFLFERKIHWNEELKRLGLYSYQQGFLGMSLIRDQITVLVPKLGVLRRALGLRGGISQIDTISGSLKGISESQDRMVSAFERLQEEVQKGLRLEDVDIWGTIDMVKGVIAEESNGLPKFSEGARAVIGGPAEKRPPIMRVQSGISGSLRDFGFLFDFCWALADIAENNLERVRGFDFKVLQDRLMLKRRAMGELAKRWKEVCGRKEQYLTLKEAVGTYGAFMKQPMNRGYGGVHPLQKITAEMPKGYFEELCREAIRENHLSGATHLARLLSEKCKSELGYKNKFKDFHMRDPTYLALYLLSGCAKSQEYGLEKIDEKITRRRLGRDRHKMEMLKLLYASPVGLSQNEVAKILKLQKKSIDHIIYASYRSSGGLNAFFEKREYRIKEERVQISFYTLRGQQLKVNRRLGQAKARKLSSMVERSFYV